MLALLLYSQEVAAEAHISSIAAWLSLPFSMSRDAVPHAWDQLYHLGGNSPWVLKVNGTLDTGLDVPAGCRVDQVHMVGHELRPR